MPTLRWGVRACVSALPWLRCEWGAAPPCLRSALHLPPLQICGGCSVLRAHCMLDRILGTSTPGERCDEGRGQGMSNKSKVTWGAQWKQRWWC